MDTAHKLTTISNNNGITVVYLVFAVLALIASVGLCIDLGHLYVVRSELQNAADASALAGAKVLYKDPLNPDATPDLDFFRARAAAAGFINQNKSDGVSLNNGTITSGYWNLALNRLESPATPTTQHVPAVVATISRSAGNNNGPVPTFFAKIFGVNESAVSSRPAVAVSGFPGSVPGGSLFPMALSSCMTNHYFAQNPLPDPAPIIEISSVYTSGGNNCYTGQWTSFMLDTNNVPSIRNLITNGNPTELNTGDDIWIQPGTEASLYRYVNEWLPAGGKEVFMAIVGTSSGDITTHSEMEIQGFARFHIEFADQSGRHITGHFIEYIANWPGTRPGGSASNTVTPPVLVY